MGGLAVVVSSVGESREKLRLSVEQGEFTSISDIVEHFGLGAVESPSENSTSRSKDVPQSLISVVRRLSCFPLEIAVKSFGFPSHRVSLLVKATLLSILSLVR